MSKLFLTVLMLFSTVAHAEEFDILGLNFHGMSTTHGEGLTLFDKYENSRAEDPSFYCEYHEIINEYKTITAGLGCWPNGFDPIFNDKNGLPTGFGTVVFGQWEYDWKDRKARLNNAEWVISCRITNTCKYTYEELIKLIMQTKKFQSVIGREYYSNEFGNGLTDWSAFASDGHEVRLREFTNDIEIRPGRIFESAPRL